MPPPINAVKTRVAVTTEDRFMPQFSTDNMVWFDLMDDSTPSAALASIEAEQFQAVANRVATQPKSLLSKV